MAGCNPELQQHGSTGTAIFTGDFPSSEQRHVSTWLQNSVTVATRNWHKCYCVRVVANFLNVGADFFNNFLISLLAVGKLRGIHFVNTNNQQFHTQCVSQQGMLTGLPILGDACFKATNTSSNNQDSTVSLRCPCHHVLDKVSVSWVINDGHIILAGFEFPQGDINGYATLMFSFQFIQDSGIPEGALPHLSSLLLKFFSGSFVDPTTFVDQVASGGGLPGIYVSNNHNVDVSLFLSHLGFDLVVVFSTPLFTWQACCEKENHSFLIHRLMGT